MKYFMLLGILLTTLTSNTYADDTEIFTGANSSAASNVVFLFDTSGSMGDPETVTRPPYDNSITYDNAMYGFNTDSLYLFRQRQNWWGSFYSTELVDDAEIISNNEVALDQITCSSVLTSIESSGEYAGKLSYSSNNGQDWDAPRYFDENNDFNLDPNNTNAQVKCSGTGRYEREYFNRIYSGNYLNYLSVEGEEESQTLTRLEILVAAAKDTLISLPDNVNVSLMRFNKTPNVDNVQNEQGGRVLVEMKPAKSNINEFITALDSLNADGGTPISESLYEAGLYMRNETPEYSGVSNSYNNIESVSASMLSGQYFIPTLTSCSTTQKIILFSDGLPTTDLDAHQKIVDQINNDNVALTSDTVSLSIDCATETKEVSQRGGTQNLPIDGSCAEELANNLFQANNIIIDTIGGFTSANDSAETKLRDIALAGGGDFYPASDYQAIKEALLDSAVETIILPSTFTSPAIAVSSYNSLELSNELYYAVFEPGESSAWKGNLKRYKITSSGVNDANDEPAVDPSTGYFSADAQSFWSTTPDGNNVKEGGVASQLGENERNIYAIIDGQLTSKLTVNYLTSLPNDVLGINVIEALTSQTNLANSTILDELDGSRTYKELLAYWILGDNTVNDGLDSSRLAIEDPMHSNPVVINYGPGEQVVFIGTNSGYLHAFNTSNGQEIFSLIPEETLANANFYMDVNDSLSEKIYGLDGPITYWHDDTNFNNVVDGTETVYLYIGMRRGGTSYYAFNVTNPLTPKLLWQKNGAQISSSTKPTPPSSSSGLSKLGQTWSALKPALVKWQGTPTYVLFSGGGYDPSEDGNNVEGPNERITSDSIGNTIFMINAKTGSVLWSAHDDVTGVSTTMKSSFPADVIPIDKDNDGYTDLLYAADTGGRVWRFDISTTSTSKNNFATGAAIADINTSGADGIAGNRRFYSQPDIVYITEGSYPFLLISIGSGYRAHPLNGSITDYHYLLKDPYGLTVPETYDTMITMADLADWESKDAIDPTKNQYGWHLLMDTSGEKILGKSLTLDNVVFVNSFSPTSNNAATQCVGNVGEGRSYSMRVPPAEAEMFCPDASQPEACTLCYPGEDCWCELNPDDVLFCPQEPYCIDPNECESPPPPPCPGPDCPKCLGGFECEEDDIRTTLKPPPVRIEPEPTCVATNTCTCEDYQSGILSGVNLSESEFDRCKLFQKNYWKEIQ